MVERSCSCVCPSILTVVCTSVLVLPNTRAISATTASDTAANSAYVTDPTGAWKGLNPTTGENSPGSDNGGSGFGPWIFAGGYNDPTLSPYGNLNHFIDGIDFTASTYNQLGSPAFGLTNANQPNFAYTSRATRTFNVPLVVGDVFRVDFDNPLIFPQLYPPAGFLFRLNTGGGPYNAGSSYSNVKNRLDVFTTAQLNEFHQVVGGNWTITDASGSYDSGLTPSDTTSGTEFVFTLTAPESYSLQFKRLSDGAVVLSHSGSLESTGTGSIDSIEIALFGNGSGNGLVSAAGRPTGEREFFFNNLQITSAGIAGDYNQDGKVDASDYVAWRKTLNQFVPQGTGADGDRDGMITQADYNIWRANYGLPSGAGMAATTVPEPSERSLVVETLAAVLAVTFSNRRSGDSSRSCDG